MTTKTQTPTIRIISCSGCWRHPRSILRSTTRTLTVRRRLRCPLVVRLHNGNRAFTYGGEHDVAAIEARHAPAGSAGYRQTSGHGDEHRRVSRLGLGDTHAAGGTDAGPTGPSTTV